MGSARRILVADRDPITRELIRGVLVEDGHRVDVACDRGTALELAGSGAHDVLLVDIELDLLADLDLGRGAPEIVVITSAIAIDDALSAIRRGAFDYVLRPFYPEDVSLTVACAAARRGGPHLDIGLGHIRKNHEMLR